MPYWDIIKFDQSKRRMQVSEAKNRPIEQIQQEYGQVCAQLGEKGFQLKVLEAEILKGHQQIVELGKEMNKAQEKAAKKQPAAPPAFAEAKDLQAVAEVADEAKN